jgi:hypothetical protein
MNGLQPSEVEPILLDRVSSHSMPSLGQPEDNLLHCPRSRLSIPAKGSGSPLAASRISARKFALTPGP